MFELESILDPEFYLSQIPAEVPKDLSSDKQKIRDFCVEHFLKKGGKFKGLSPTPIFEPQYYYLQLSETEREKIDSGDEGGGKYTLFDHFCKFACGLEINPSPFFNIAYYSSLAGVPKESALSHYFSEGKSKGIDPSPYFNVSYYINLAGSASSSFSSFSSLKEGLPTPENALCHFLTKGEPAGLSPTPVINVEYYAQVAHVSKNNAVRHFILEGLYRGLNPSPIFDLNYYAGLAQVGRSQAVQHYLLTGMGAGINPSPYFDAVYYASRVKVSPKVEPKEAFGYFALKIAIGEDKELVSCSPYIDYEYYGDTNDGVAPSKVLLDFVLRGEKEGISPTPFFEASYYVSQLPVECVEEIEKSKPERLSPFKYFVMHGLDGTFSPSPFFNVDFYCKKYALAPKDAIKTFFTVGLEQNHTCCPVFDPVYFSKANKDEARRSKSDGNISWMRYFVWKGEELGCAPSVYFDMDFYCDQVGISKKYAARHFLTEGVQKGINPSLYFDVKYYALRNGLSFKETIVDFFSRKDLNKIKTIPFFDTRYCGVGLEDFLNVDNKDNKNDSTINNDNNQSIPNNQGIKMKGPSPFFRVDFYISNLKDKKIFVDPQKAYEHFLTEGLDLGVNPCPLFEPIYYATLAGISEEEAVKHFFTQGMYEGKDPSPFFDSAFYNEQLSEAEKRRVSAGQITLLEHYVFEGEAKGYLPCVLFDKDYYKSQMKGDEGGSQPAETVPLLEHYMQDESVTKSPSPFFDVQYYASSAGVSEANAVRHFLLEGMKQALRFSPFFDIAHYCKITKVEPSRALRHFLLEGANNGISPLPLFDMQFYAKVLDKKTKTLSDKNPDAANKIKDAIAQISAKKNNALRFYLMSGQKDGESPSPFFDIPYYLSKQKRIALTPENALYDFLTIGESEGCVPTPYFDEEFYKQQLSPQEIADIKGGSLSFFGHFLLQIYDESRSISPNPFVDVAYYSSIASVTPEKAVRDYFINGVDKNISPSPLFDIQYYLTQIPIAKKDDKEKEEVGKADIVVSAEAKTAEASNNPLYHYLNYLQADNIAAVYDPSPYFDTDFYSEAHKSVLPKETPKKMLARHFLMQGAKAGLNPSPYVDLIYYTFYVKAECTYEGALRHFLLNGLKMGLNLSPFFDVSFYCSNELKKELESDPKAIAVKPEKALSDYLLKYEQAKKGSTTDVSPYFENKYYLKLVEDAKLEKKEKAILSPVRHFILYGEKMGLSPSPFFNVTFYATLAGIPCNNTLRHYLTKGCRENINPCSMFDEDFYKSKLPSDVVQKNTASQQTLLRYFLTEGEKRGDCPTPYFEMDFYLNHIPESEKEKIAGNGDTKISGIRHFSTIGSEKGYNPNLFFDTKYYKKKSNSSLPSLGQTKPFDHYLLWGDAQGLNPSLLFETNFYLSQLPVGVCQKIKENHGTALGYYLNSGLHESYSPTPYFDNEFYVTACKSAMEGKPLLVGKLPGKNEPISFTEEAVLGDGNCGFTILGKRDEIADILSKSATDEKAREELWEEIWEAFQSNNLKQTAEFEVFYQTYMVTNSEKDRQKLEDYCKREDVFRLYVESYRSNLWLGYKSALLYARLSGITLYVWKRSGVRQTIEIMGSTIFSPSGQIIHMLLTQGYTHFNLLVEAQNSPAPGKNNYRHFIEIGQYQEIDPSPFFDSKYYRETYSIGAKSSKDTRKQDVKDAKDTKDAKKSETPFLSFLKKGEKQQHIPTLFFDVDFYFQQLRKANPNGVLPTKPLRHFLTEKNPQNPLPFFDVYFYNTKTGHKNLGLMDSLKDFIVQGQVAGIDPSPFFDTAFYKSNPNYRAERIPAFKHFFLKGEALKFNPSPYFDPLFYSEQLKKLKRVSKKSLSLIRDFLTYGEPQGCSPTPFFDEEYFTKTQRVKHFSIDGVQVSAVRYFLLMCLNQESSPSPYFDREFYLKQLEVSGYKLETTEESVFHHFMGGVMKLGRREIWQNCSPSPIFDAQYYAEKSRLDSTHVSAIYHFLFLRRPTEGWCDPSPFFNADFYIYQLPLEEQANFRKNKILAVRHYLMNYLYGPPKKALPALSPAPFINYGNKAPDSVCRQFILSRENQDFVTSAFFSVNKIPCFDRDYYLSSPPDRVARIYAGQLSAIRDYLTEGDSNNPPMEFDRDYYSQQLVEAKDEHLGEVTSKRIPLIWHYLLWGWKKNYKLSRENTSLNVFEPDQVDKILNIAQPIEAYDENALTRIENICSRANVKFVDAVNSPNTLVKNNVDSAVRVVSQSKANFIDLYGNLFSNSTDAEKFYKAAKEIVAGVELQFLNIKQENSPFLNNPAFKNPDSSVSPDQSQSYQAIFGKLDYFNTDQSTTVYSPEAYFYDLFRIVTDCTKKGSNNDNGVLLKRDYGKFKYWLDILNRRPDLCEIPLDESHTLKEIPYLEVVNNVLARQYVTLRQIKAQNKDSNKTIDAIFSNEKVMLEMLNEIASQEDLTFKGRNQKFTQLAFRTIANDTTLHFSAPRVLNYEAVESYLSQLDLTLFDLYVTLSMQSSECVFMDCQNPDVKYNLALAFLKLTDSEMKWLNSFFETPSATGDASTTYKTDYQDFLDATKLSKEDLSTFIPYQGTYKSEELDFYKSLYINRNLAHIVELTLDIDSKSEIINNLTSEVLHRIAFFTFLAKKLSVDYLDMQALIDAAGIDKKIEPKQAILMAKIMWLHQKSSVPIRDICSFVTDLPLDIFNNAINKLKSVVDVTGKNPILATVMNVLKNNKCSQKALKDYKDLLTKLSIFLGITPLKLGSILAFLNSLNILKGVESDAILLKSLLCLLHFCKLCNVDTIGDLVKLALFSSSLDQLPLADLASMCGLNPKKGNIDYVIKLYLLSQLLAKNKLDIKSLLSSSLGILEPLQVGAIQKKASAFLLELSQNLTKQATIDSQANSSQSSNNASLRASSTQIDLRESFLYQQLSSHLSLPVEAVSVVYTALNKVNYSFNFKQLDVNPPNSDSKLPAFEKDPTNLNLLYLLYRISGFAIAANITLGKVNSTTSDLTLFMSAVVKNLQLSSNKRCIVLITPNDVRQVFLLKTLQQQFDTTENNFLDYFMNPHAANNKSALMFLTGWGDDTAVLDQLNLGDKYKGMFDQALAFCVPCIKYEAIGDVAQAILSLRKLNSIFTLLATLNGNAHVLELASKLLTFNRRNNLKSHFENSVPSLKALFSNKNLADEQRALILKVKLNADRAWIDENGEEYLSAPKVSAVIENILSKLDSLLKPNAASVEEFVLSELDNMITLLESEPSVEGIEQQLTTSIGSVLKAIDRSSYDSARRQFAVRVRDVLVEKVLHLYADTPFKDDLNINTVSDLSEYLLLDLEMSGAFSTSFVVQGTASLQWYLQRCRLGLEVGVTSNIPDSWWTWIEMYRVWEANRKVLLYPESYVEPDLRTLKSPEFNEFVSGIMQSSLDKDSLLNAYENFFHKVALLSKLTVVDAYEAKYPGREPNTPDADYPNTYFLARTTALPYTYYYCTADTLGSDNNKKIENYSYWQKIPTQINAASASILHCFGRPFVFWNEIKYKDVAAKDRYGNKVIHQMVSCKSQYTCLLINGGWQSPQVVYDNNINLADIIVHDKVREDKQITRISTEVLTDPTRLTATFTTSVRNTLEVGEFLMAGESLYADVVTSDSAQTPGYLTFTFTASNVVMSFNPKSKDVSVHSFNDTNNDARYDNSNNPSSSLADNPVMPGPWAPMMVKYNSKYYLFYQGTDNKMMVSSSANGTQWEVSQQMGGDWKSDNGIWVTISPQFKWVCMSNHLDGNHYINILPSSNENSPFKNNSWVNIYKNDWGMSHLPTVIQTPTPNDTKLYLIFVDGNDSYIVIRTNPGTVTGNRVEWNNGDWLENRLVKLRATTAVSVVWFNNTFFCTYADDKGKVNLRRMDDMVHHADDIHPEDNVVGDENWVTDCNIGLSASNDGKNLYIVFKNIFNNPDGVVEFYDADARLNPLGFKQRVIPTYVPSTAVSIFVDPDNANFVKLVYGDENGFIHTPTINLAHLNNAPSLSPNKNSYYQVVSPHVATILEDGCFCIVKNSYKGSNRSDYQSSDFFYDYSTINRGYPVLKPPMCLKLQSDGTLGLFNNLDNTTGNIDDVVENAAYSFYYKQIKNSNAGLEISGYDYPPSESLKKVATISFSRPWVAYDETQGIFLTPFEKFTENDYLKPSALKLMQKIDLKLDVAGCDNEEIQGVAQNNKRDFVEVFSSIIQKINGEGLYVKYLQGGFGAAVSNCTMRYDDLKVFQLYLWEIFFHAPFFVANYLHNQQQFENARQWYHYLYNPLKSSQSFSFPSLFASPLTTLETAHNDQNKGYAEALTSAVIDVYHRHDFDPHRIAILRPVAYQKSVVMHYIQNLIDWADYLFTLDTRETITQATGLYMMANDLLGRQPQGLGLSTAPTQSLVFYNYLVGSMSLDHTVELLLNRIENTLQISSLGSQPLPIEEFPLVFSIPENKDFMGYWDKVADRLFKIRHCQNINGVKQELSLFSPEIDPRALVRAAAMGGINLADFLPAAIPIYRYHVLLEQTRSFISQVMQLGNTLLSAIERQDNENLQMISLNNQAKLLDVMTRMRQIQVDQANYTVEQVASNLASAQQRSQYLSQLIENGLLAEESSAMTLKVESQLFYVTSGVLELVAGILAPIPQATEGEAGLGPALWVTEGGAELSQMMHCFSVGSKVVGDVLNYVAEDLNQVAIYRRRADEWKQQLVEANSNCDSLTRQVQIAQMQADITKQDYDSHQLQIQQQADLIQYYQSKFTNLDLYRWMVDQLQTLYKQAFDLALASAKKTEKAYQFEVNQPTKTFIGNNYYTFFRKGLLAGEALMLDLSRLEQTYLDDNKRLFEIQKIISLKDLKPEQLLYDSKPSANENLNKFEQFVSEIKKSGKGAGTLTFWLTNGDFDEFSELLNRSRVKRVSISIPGLAKPYQNTYFVLTHVSNDNGDDKANNSTSGGNSNNTIGYRDASGEQVILSSAINDAGLFSAPLQDARYLPFEGTKVTSKWTLEFRGPPTNINNIIFQLEYTAISEPGLGNKQPRSGPK